MKKLLIAGVTSGSGKTTVVLGILKALQKKYRIQSYKVGPDYVDTKFHTRITNRPARNLDSFLVPNANTLRYLFTEDTDGVDFGLVEGVMGLYDGLGTDKDAFSTASVAKQLGLPIVLVVNGRATSTTTAAILKGLIDFDPQLQIKGVIINNVMSENHYQLIKGAIERYLPGLAVLGYLPKDPRVSLPSRQLGLVPDAELLNVDEKIGRIAQMILDHVDLEQLISLATEEQTQVEFPFTLPNVHLKLGIARDEAFNFYYADNLKLLERLGVQLVNFSPLEDSQLPPVDALYLGGGYPEEFASQLARNESMKTALRDFSRVGKPIYAECGGLMYLGQQLKTKGQTFQMVGALDGSSTMTGRLRRFGYCVASPVCACFLGQPGEQIYGHEFHHSTYQPTQPDAAVLTMKKERDGQVVNTWTGGYQANQTFASYLHVHFYQSERLIRQLVTAWGGLEP